MPEPGVPPYVRLESALAQFIAVAETQGQQHIKPLHQHPLFGFSVGVSCCVGRPGQLLTSIARTTPLAVSATFALSGSARLHRD
jgi:hypothetical protein